jgi:hypothetical protein
MVGRVTLFAAVWTGLVLPACEESAPVAVPSTRTPSQTSAPSNEPDGLVVERLKVWSLDELAAAVAERGADLLLFLPDAQPTEVHFWEGEGHLHIRTEYIDHPGEEVVIIQAGLDEGTASRRERRYTYADTAA